MKLCVCKKSLGEAPRGLLDTHCCRTNCRSNCSTRSRCTASWASGSFLVFGCRATERSLGRSSRSRPAHGCRRSSNSRTLRWRLWSMRFVLFSVRRRVPTAAAHCSTRSRSRSSADYRTAGVGKSCAPLAGARPMLSTASNGLLSSATIRWRWSDFWFCWWIYLFERERERERENGWLSWLTVPVGSDSVERVRSSTYVLAGRQRREPSFLSSL